MVESYVKLEFQMSKDSDTVYCILQWAVLVTNVLQLVVASYI
jgi:hypothetical protein